LLHVIGLKFFNEVNDKKNLIIEIHKNLIKKKPLDEKSLNRNKAVTYLSYSKIKMQVSKEVQN
jgi:hypothetical protein